MSQQSKLPKTTYKHPDAPEEWVKNELGRLIQFQGFNSNILFAECAIKMLPKLRLLIKGKKHFKNILTNKENPYVLAELAYGRLMQIWHRGTYICVTRNESGEQITNLEVIYPTEKLVEFTIKGEKQKISDVWETINKCKNCNGVRYVQLTEEDLNELFPVGVDMCPDCGTEKEVEIEVKPSFKEMELARDKNTSSIWREIQGEVPIKYALENCDIAQLASDQGGFFDDFADGKIPKYPDIYSIMNSEDVTSFPSKNYYETSINIIYKEFMYYFDLIFVNIVDLLHFQKDDRLFDTIGKATSRDKLKETTDLE